jgi:hypothetical protein
MAVDAVGKVIAIELHVGTRTGPTHSRAGEEHSELWPQPLFSCDKLSDVDYELSDLVVAESAFIGGHFALAIFRDLNPLIVGLRLYLSRTQTRDVQLLAHRAATASIRRMAERAFCFVETCRILLRW